jgi:hypothetical protein
MLAISKKQNRDLFVDCHYKNTSKTIQIVRLIDSSMGLEKIIYPGQKIIFNSSMDSILEVSEFSYLTSLVSERLECKSLTI